MTPPGRTQEFANAETVDGSTTPRLAVNIADPVDGFSDKAPRYVGGALLGAGGMGEVRTTVDRRIGREVAVKTLLQPSDNARQRFLREARVQGQLEHPSVVPVHDLTIADSGEIQLYMKRVRGMTLEEVLGSLAADDVSMARRFPDRRLYTAFVSVCRAVDYAHSRGVVHRDLKPSNIMLGEFGEVHVLDWGIAKVSGASDPSPASEPEKASKPSVARSTGDSAETAYGTLLGTPGYMAPEQARGEVNLIDARTDVFALGAILFEVLTRTPLIKEPNAIERIRATLALTQAPSPMARAPNKEIPPELEKICIEALAPNRESRTASAGTLAESIDRFLDGDRDVALRKSLADNIANEAEALLNEPTKTDVESAENRATAVRLLTRALALDPHHAMASDKLGTLLLEAPKVLPKQAALELERVHTYASRLAGKLGLVRIGSVFLLGTLGTLMGVRNPLAGLVAVFGLILVVFVNYVWLRAKSERTRIAAQLITVLFSSIALTSMNLAFGPTLLVPILTMINGILALGQRDFRLNRAVFSLGLIPVTGWFIAALFGFVEPPYQITPDQIVIPARLVSFPPALTQFLLAAIALAQALLPLLLIVTLRGRMRSIEERLFLHSYHLRALARGGNATSQSSG